MFANGFEVEVAKQPVKVMDLAWPSVTAMSTWNNCRDIWRYVLHHNICAQHFGPQSHLKMAHWVIKDAKGFP